jgi:hypothetical protein
MSNLPPIRVLAAILCHFKEPSFYIYIYTKSKTLLYFKALMEREKERRAFIVTYIWVYRFLNTVLIHITIYSIYGFLSKRINIY